MRYATRCGVLLISILFYRATLAQEDWPHPPEPFPTLSVRLRAVLVADDDGTYRVNITPQEVKTFVDRANEIFAIAKIQLLFDPAVGSGDWEYLNSTLLNTMTGVEHPDWSSQKDEANAIAAQTPERILAFFRWGPGEQPTAGGFSWTDYDFVVMPGLTASWCCGGNDPSVLAHETGHYLGLAHPFAVQFFSVDAAETYFNTNNSDPAVFDGDGLDETEPDPYVEIPGIQCDTNTVSLTLGSEIFTLPRKNIMTYYVDRGNLVPSQAWIMRQVLMLRMGRDLTQMVNEEAVAFFEGESFTVAVTRGWTTNQDMSGFHPGMWSADTQLVWLDSELGAELTFSCSIPDAGQYDVYGSFTCASDFGTHTHTINGQTSFPIDLYSPFVMPTGTVYLGRFDFQQGTNEWKVTATGTNVHSNPVTYGFGLDYIMITDPASTEIVDQQMTPADFDLIQNNPNPFNARTRIAYTISTPGMVSLTVYDQMGRKIETLVHGHHQPNQYHIDFDAGHLPSGIYFYRLQAGNNVVKTRKMCLIR